MNDLENERTSRLLIYLEGCAPGVWHQPEHEVWRETLNGRRLVFLRYGEQTYCLLPLEISTVSTEGVTTRDDAAEHA